MQRTKRGLRKGIVEALHLGRTTRLQGRGQKGTETLRVSGACF